MKVPHTILADFCVKRNYLKELTAHRKVRSVMNCTKYTYCLHVCAFNIGLTTKYISASYHVFKYHNQVNNVPLSVRLQVGYTGTTTHWTKPKQKLEEVSKMHFLQVCLITISVLLTVNGDQSSLPCPKSYDKKMACNLICNFMMDSDASNSMKLLQTKLENLLAMVNTTSAQHPTAVPVPPTPTVAPPSSCKEQFEKYNSMKSQVFTLKIGSEQVPVYCHMVDFGCGDGGWTVAMKIDGAKKTFDYDSKFWSNQSGYNLPGGQTGFDSQETKLPTYWNTPFSKICLGMKIGNQMKFTTINKQANSLYSLIADGKYRSTSLGRNTWKSLIGSQASLQTGCNKEGFNVVGGASSYARARIGILGNDQNDCLTCDSRIGFGTGGLSSYSSTCGNDSPKGYTSDNGAQNIKAMGYILVQ